MGPLIEDIREAVYQGTLREPFRGTDVLKACPGCAENTPRTFLSKHCLDNPSGTTEHFKRHARGLYSLIA